MVGSSNELLMHPVRETGVGKDLPLHQVHFRLSSKISAACTLDQPFN